MDTSIENGSLLAMEHILHRTLKEQLREKALSAEEIAAILYQVLRALEYIHTQQPTIVYRKIQPGNLLFESRVPHLSVKLGTFRIATEGPMAPVWPYNLPYSAPEAFSQQTYDALADIWSLGVMILQCLHQRLPRNTPGTVQGRLWAEDVIGCAERENHRAWASRYKEDMPETELRCFLYQFLVSNMLIMDSRESMSAAECLKVGKLWVFRNCID